MPPLVRTLRDVRAGDRIRLGHMRDDYSYRVLSVEHAAYSALLWVETPDGRQLDYHWQANTPVEIVERADGRTE